MKKLLLSCFLALGIGANAQFNYTGDFEGTDPVYGQFGGGTVTAAAACAGSWGGQLAMSATQTQSGWMVQTGVDAVNQVSNGFPVTLSANYKKAAGTVGTITLAYFEFDSGSNLWTIYEVGTPASLTSAATTTCSSLTAVIPGGALKPDKIYGFGVWVRRTSGTGNVYVDNIKFVQDVPTAAPASCATVTYPTAGSTIPAGNLNMKWNALSDAWQYKVTVGTTPGASDVYNGTVTGTTLSLNALQNTTYYAKVVPTNALGDASGCTEFSFSTSNQVAHCGPLTSTAPTAIAPIKSVNFAGVTNTSDASATTIGSFSPHEFYPSVVFPVVNGSANLPLTVQGTTNGNSANGWAMSVFIDWNNDGDFDDAGEQYFNTTATMIRVAGVTDNPVTLTGNISVPSGVTPGTKTMRIKYNYSGATSLNSPLTAACNNMINGQAEDYTVNVTAPSTPPACTIVTAPADAATNVPANATITWNAANSADGYKVYIGTTSGGTDVANGTVVNATSYSISLTPFTKYYLKVVPYNVAGDATSCTEISFTTGNVVYCDTVSYPNSEPITNITFGGINNNSDGTTGGTNGFENFTSITGTVKQGTTYPISVNGNSDGDYDNYYVVFIDWNQNGKLDDAGEVYFADGSLTLKNSTGTGTPATGSISVPADAKLGTTRMRIKKEYSSGVPLPTSNFANPCLAGTTFGQGEDYTLNIVDATAATANVDKNRVSVYPNPFHDILKISDVKGVQSISVSDVSGRQVKSMKASAELNLSDLKTGLYIVTLHMEDGTVKTVKAIKK